MLEKPLNMINRLNGSFWLETWKLGVLREYSRALAHEDTEENRNRYIHVIF